MINLGTDPIKWIGRVRIEIVDALKKYVLMESNVDATSECDGQVSPQIQMHADSEESDGCHINHKPNQRCCHPATVETFSSSLLYMIFTF